MKKMLASSNNCHDRSTSDGSESSTAGGGSAGGASGGRSPAEQPVEQPVLELVQQQGPQSVE